RNSDVFTAVRVIASDLATNPIEYSDKRISVLLNKAPNDHMTAWAFKFALAANMLLNGNSFARVTKNPSGQVTGFELVPNSQMVVKQDDTTGIISYEYTPDSGRSQRLNASEVLHFKCFTQDGYKGISPLYSLHDEVGVQKSGHALLKGFFNTGVQGTGILKVNKTQLDSKAKENIRNKFEAANSGDNALKTIILDNDMDYKQLEVNTDVLNLVNSSDWTTKQIAKAFGLPLDRLGIESEHSNAVQSNVMYLQNTLIQYFTCFTSEMDAKLSTGDNRYSFNTDKLFSADPATMQELAVKGLQGGVLTTNEARAKLNLPPITGGDEIMASLNYTPLSNLTNYQNTRQRSDPENESR
ncbi:phage portal protein, partial [Lacticaseibacillus rhamnosus]|nr:phage portal protein [Lacticaseibacillus rhamnosus]